LSEHPEIKLLIIDSFRRVSGIEENDAGEISEFLTTKLRPLSLEYGLTIILIHHLRKGLGRNPIDEMDEIRGSSDLANYSDVILILERPKGAQNRVILKQVKSRRSPELEPLLINIEWGDKVKFICQGSALEYLNDVERCKNQILVWMEENNITTFETKEVNDAMRSYKFSAKTTQIALAELVAEGKLIKLKRGVFAKPTEALTSFINNNNKTRDKMQLWTERTSIYSSVHSHTHPEEETESKTNGQMDNMVSVHSVHLSKPETEKERNGQTDKTYNISVHSVHSAQTSSKPTDKGKKRHKSDELSGKSEDSSYWQRLERDIIDTIKNPSFTRRIYRFELISFLEQREYKAQEIEKVLNKVIEQGIVIQYPDESLDINFSKFHGDG
jgi:hypothetical protein